MRIKNIFKRKPSKYDQLVDDIQASFNSVGKDFEWVRNEYDELHVVISGVACDLRDLEKENKILKDALAGLNGYVDEVEANLDELKQHTASLIMQHDEQINQTQVEDERKLSVVERIWDEICGDSPSTPMKPTLAGKVEAIIEHLDLDVSVKPEKVTKASVEAKKKKPVKKGKK